MRLKSLAQMRVVVTALCGAGVALVLGAPHANADEYTKRTVITVNEPMQVTDRLLQPGTYVFMLLNGHANMYTDRNTVEILDGKQTHVVDTVIAIPAYRVHPAAKSTFTFWETPPGTARALRDWYYPGDSYGEEFPYPKHPAMLMASTEVQAWTPPPAPAPVPVAATPAPPAPAPAAQPPAQVAEAAPAPAPAPEPAPAALPKTASPFPAIGLAGLLMAGLYGLLRWRRAIQL